MNESLVELWVDDRHSEFAIFLNSQVVAKTSEKTKFTKKMDQTYCFDGYDYDWNHTIDKWITFYLSNKYVADFTRPPRSEPKIHLPRFIPSRKSIQRHRPKIKCNFCGLRFYMDTEREEHELRWHQKTYLKTKN